MQPLHAQLTPDTVPALLYACASQPDALAVLYSAFDEICQAADETYPWVEKFGAQQ